MRQLVKVFLSALFALTLLVLPQAFSADDRIIDVNRPNDVPSFLGYVPNRFIVVLKPEVGKVALRQASSLVIHTGIAEFDKVSDQFAVSRIEKQFAGAESSQKAGAAQLAGYHKVTIETGTLEEAMAAYEKLPMVDHVEPIGIHSLYATPNDFYYSPYQWHLNAASDHDVDAPEAWDIETGADATVVAILDSGTRYYHPDLGGVNGSPSNPGASRGNMWINTAELNGTAGVDDDLNTYVDDWIGYDFIQSTSGCWTGEDCDTKDNDPRDFNGHGTHTSGIVGMLTNDGYGMCGIAGGWGNGSQAVTGNGVKIMALRMGYSYNHPIYGEVGVVLMDAAAEAFYYAANNGASIASCSWGSSNSGGIAAAATYFVNSGGLIFVAAGNANNEVAGYLNSRSDCISVSATDENDNGASFTTYGTWVDICAPGNNIYATYHDHLDPNTNYWAALSGTSMACPLTAGIAALVWSKNPSWTAAQVQTQLFTTSDNINAFLSAKYIGKMGAGRVNAFNAVNTGSGPGVPVAAFTGSPTSGCAPLNVNFTDQSTGDITSWGWAFGDGGTSTAQSPSHSYATSGSYTVTLTVTGPGGSDPEVKTNYVTVSGVPTANIVGSPTSGQAPLTVNFTDQSTGSATSWSWNFGDAGTSSAQNPSHVYASAGTFTVSLTASNSCGSDGETKTNYITVTAPPAQQCDDFADGNISNWINSTGTWTATGGYMKGNSNTNNAKRTSPFGSFGATTVDCDVRMNTGRSERKARIIWAYVNASNYRFVEADDINNRWRIYERVGGTNTLRLNVNSSISTTTWYDVSVTIASNGSASFSVNGTPLGSYNFSTAVSGLVGCGFNRSNSDFDNFCVGTPGGAPAVPFEEPLASMAPNELPDVFEVFQNYPNPFNPKTEISFFLPEAARVSVEIFNILGQRIATLLDGEANAGLTTLTWDSEDEVGVPVSSGIYFYRVLVEERAPVTKKMILIK